MSKFIDGKIIFDEATSVEKKTDTRSYPVDALGPLTEFTKGVQQTVQAPMALCAGSVLAFAALGVQGFTNVEGLGNRQHPINLYLLSIAKSGERKSSVDALVSYAVYNYQKMALVQFEKDKQKFEFEQKKYEKSLSNLSKKSGSSEDLEAVLASKPIAPIDPRRVVSDATLEGLYRHMETSDPSVGLFSDEGGTFIGGFSMKSDNRVKAVSAFSNFWDGKQVDRVRSGEGTSSIFGRRLSMHLMAQPEVTAHLTQDDLAIGQGFLPRFLICQPESRIGFRPLADQTESSRIATLAGGKRLTEILTTVPTTEADDQRQLKPPLLLLSEAAKDQLQAYYAFVEESQRPGGRYSTVTGFASKSCEQAARIAAVLTLWENLEAGEVSEETMGNAITLANYYLEEAIFVLGAAEASSNASDVEKLLAWVVNKWPLIDSGGRLDKAFVLPSDVQQYGPYALRSDIGKIKALLDQLVDQGELSKHEDVEVDGSRREVAYKVLPK